MLLGLYNGRRFPMDLTDLRVLDTENLNAALEVITSDARSCRMEVHDWLNRVTGRSDFGHRFEHLAHEFAAFRRGRCKREHDEQNAIRERIQYAREIAARPTRRGGGRMRNE